MAEGTEPIRQDLDNLRGSMSETIGEIDNRVRDTIDDTVDNVRQAFDLKRQVREHPWLSVGLALTVGYLAGGMGGEQRHEPQYVQPGQAMRYYPEHGYRPVNTQAERGNGGKDNRQSQTFRTQNAFSASQAYGQRYGQPYEQHQSSGMSNLISRVASPLADELQTMAIATMHSATRMLRESLKENIPQFEEEYTRIRAKREHPEHGEHAEQEQARAVGADHIYDDASNMTPGSTR
jgi:ElaB/YqjD/DUF883 family membrane-anchored ribosome-binding protein/predicted transcriptional regulator